MIEYYLHEWKDDPARKALVLHGARQVGKTYVVRMLGESYTDVLEVNFEKNPRLATVFEYDMEPERILRDLGLACKHSIQPGRTLLFLDEIQQCPAALTALRYFQEEMPDLHVIAAGSLFGFALDQVGLPVGRVNTLHMYPFSFLEFLVAKGKVQIARALIESAPAQSLPEIIHTELLRDFGEYLAVGGMPEAVSEWIAHQDLLRCSRVHSRLTEAYRQDFRKYAKKYQVKYVDLVFEEVPRLLGQKFVYSRLRGSWRKRELQPAFDLLEKADVVHRICQTAATGVPLGAKADPDRFKPLFLDVGLAQSILGMNGNELILDPVNGIVNIGAIVEAVVGQELLAYGDPYRAASLYYWHREERSSNAEIDYMLADGVKVLPIEVKAGRRGRLKSIRLFMDARREAATCPIRFSMHPFSEMEDLLNYPLYAAATLAARKDSVVEQAMRMMTKAGENRA